ncbi:hypothetical protein HK102_013993 [Quaeritorhiza haematococci]|nr:hypothetical protein HK102_013993 [Quaeritorhiza haematococci]
MRVCQADNEFECEFVWSGDGNDVKVTGTFDNWSQSVILTPSGINGGHAFAARVRIPKNNDASSSTSTVVLYKFVVDGVWQHDPSQPIQTDEYGNINNRVELVWSSAQETPVENSASQQSLPQPILPPPQSQQEAEQERPRGIPNSDSCNTLVASRNTTPGSSATSSPLKTAVKLENSANMNATSMELVKQQQSWFQFVMSYFPVSGWTA